MASTCMKAPTTDSSVAMTSFVSMRVLAMCLRCLQNNIHVDEGVLLEIFEKGLNIMAEKYPLED